MKNKWTIFDCKNEKNVVYLRGKIEGSIKFINCENVLGIEFGVAMKITYIDISNLPQLKYLNIQRTKIKEVKAPLTCMVYCKNYVKIYRD